MATFRAVNSACASIRRMLADQAALASAAAAGATAPAGLNVETCSLNGAPFNGQDPSGETNLFLVVYRIQPSPHQRPQPPSRGLQRPRLLAVDVNFLLVPWVKPGASAQPPGQGVELDILSWAMLQLQRRPILDRASLVGPAAGEPGDVWNGDETIHVTPDPLSHEALFRLWDCLQPKYRLSAAYVARVIHLEERGGEELGPVLETQFGYRQTADALAEAAP